MGDDVNRHRKWDKAVSFAEAGRRAKVARKRKKKQELASVRTLLCAHGFA